MRKFHTSYMNILFDRPDEITDLVRKIRDSGIEFDTVVGTGVSGLIPLKQVAEALDLHWLAVRKPDDSSHSDWNVSGELGDSWVLLDDFVSTGRTAIRVIDDIARVDSHTQFKGVIQYESIVDGEELMDAFMSPENLIRRTGYKEKIQRASMSGEERKYGQDAKAGSLRSRWNAPSKERIEVVW